MNDIGLYKLMTKPVFISNIRQRYGNTFQRLHPLRKERELMAYGAANSTVNQTRFRLEERVDSVFGRKVLRLVGAAAIGPKAFIEHIPASWSSIDVSIYHAYLLDFDIGDALVRIQVASMQQIFEESRFDRSPFKPTQILSETPQLADQLKFKDDECFEKIWEAPLASFLNNSLPTC